MPPSLGPFTLHEPIARGGMGEVWRGGHRRSGRPVAIKVLTSADARSPAAIHAFRQEVRAAAGLDHPHISWVLDYGLLPAEVAGAALVPGSPYLVAELAEGGDLRPWLQRPPPWPDLREALLQLLDALAYAHARGVIHRDLKPSNVLLAARDAADGRARTGVLLADFGLAFRLDEAPGPAVRARAGTPSYMAPEQAGGHWRAIGPWTDLYALGLLVWALVQGEVPAVADREGTELEWNPPRIAAPTGLARWISRLVQPDPADRFQCAADAAAALCALEREGEGLSWAPRQVPVALAPPLDTFPSGSNRTFTLNQASAPAVRLSTPPMVAAPAELPADWRPSRRAAPLSLVDAGLGIFGLRRPAIVGRDAERDALWSALRQARERGGSAVVMLTGPRGFGKTRLLEWLVSRAEELGVASCAAGKGGEGGALNGMLLRALRGMDLDERALVEHLSGGCAGLPPTPRGEAEHLARLLVAPTDDPGRQPQSGRLPPLLRALRRRARDRVLIIAIDDASADPDALELARHLLERAEGDPTLLVLAVSDEALADPGEVGAGLAALAERRDVLQLSIGPLHPEHWPALARASLHLAPDLSAALAARAAGNPLFASLLLDDWVQRGALRVAEQGFTLVEGASAELPDTVDALVSGQLDRLGRERPPEDLRAVELAAVLGLHVDRHEWRALCALAATPPAEGLSDHLMARRLARAAPSADGWSFAHNMLREVILARIGSRNDLISKHLLAARALASLPPTPDRLGRLGRHWLAAGQPAEAVAPLLDAATGALSAGRYIDLGALLDLAERCVPASPPELADARYARLWSMRGQLNHFGRANRPAARGWYELAEQAARRAGSPALAADMLRRRGGVSFGLGDRVTAERLLRQALDELADLPASIEHMDVLRDLGSVLRMVGDPAGAERTVQRSLDLAIAAGREDRVAMALHSLGMIRKDQGDLRGAVGLLERATEGLRATGDLQQLGSVLNTLGSAYESLGDLAASEQFLNRSLSTLAEIGANYEALPRYNLGVMHLMTGRMAEARALLVPGFRRVQIERWPWLSPFYAAAVALLEARDGRWGEMEQALAHLRAHAPENSAELRRVGRMLEEAAGLAEMGTRADLAAESRGAAEQVWRALGAPGGAERGAEAARPG